jgi:hypothetical protein
MAAWLLDGNGAAAGLLDGGVAMKTVKTAHLLGYCLLSCPSVLLLEDQGRSP